MTEITFTDQVTPGTVRRMSTGPSGLLLGVGPTGQPMTLSLFRPQPTRIFVALPEFQTWLIAFRSVCLGAHLSVIAADHRRWLTLADAVRAAGGTVDVLHDADALPGRGRPYRPSLIVDEVEAVPATRRLGAWQSVLAVGDPGASAAVAMLRASDGALIAPLESRAAEQLSRAYALTSGQVRTAADIGASEVAMATFRRVATVTVVPSAEEYRLLFGG